jgi:hypothetical protein
MFGIGSVADLLKICVERWYLIVIAVLIGFGGCQHHSAGVKAQKLEMARAQLAAADERNHNLADAAALCASKVKEMQERAVKLQGVADAASAAAKVARERLDVAARAIMRAKPAADCPAVVKYGWQKAREFKWDAE